MNVFRSRRKKALNVVITPLRPSEVASLRRLFLHALETDFHYFPYEYRHLIARQNRHRHLLTAYLRKERVIYLAKQSQQLVGYVIAGMLPDGRGYIYWLYVDPTARGDKIGVKLVEQAKETLRKLGATEIDLVTYNFDKYYKKLGFEYSGTQEIHGVTLHEMTYNYHDHAPEQKTSDASRPKDGKRKGARQKRAS
ncbi:MAG TPA: GNAT family N-acetyltransferase [Candidatus Saccharimonadales bacterium]|nr:GNAT family N-acetyltransferase [Candidatus Saccharimonadales bacterium]